jgi:hypothetical protein
VVWLAQVSQSLPIKLKALSLTPSTAKKKEEEKEERKKRNNETNKNKLKKALRGWWCDSGVQYLSSMHEVAGSMPSNEKKN